MLGRLYNNEAVVLIDGGNTHNFIDHNVVSKFGLHVVKDKTFQVMVANREKIDCAGICLALTLLVQGYPITANFYVLPIMACQAVLGVQWFEMLGPIKNNYRELTMTFKKA
ncbi:hypothetical protein Acr_00g0062620 [Actinidia rufa]|uniref:Uncharacterized protein n=1 Tax=Actinidia rufa TaxID=165716 RepID=A0A7J0DQF8_9ERIC|nr:hypothetical protein Acr_00g0062620 [Actinidia rufa]